MEPYRLSTPATPRSARAGRRRRWRAGQELAVDLSSQPAAAPSDGRHAQRHRHRYRRRRLRAAYPCGTVPANSTVNFGAGQTAANLATVRVPPDGRVCFWSMVETNLVIDVAGWYAPPAARAAAVGVAYQTVEPVRVLDTRRADLAPTGEGRDSPSCRGALRPHGDIR